jgi:hypothetical protein
VKKKCVSCGKQIPSVALNCVFCSSRQPAPDFSDIDVLQDAVDRARSKSEARAAVSASGGLFDDDDPSSKTEHTLVGMRIADLGHLDETKPKETKDTNGSPAQLRHTQAIPVVEKPPEPKLEPKPEPPKPAPPATETQPPAPVAREEVASGLPWEMLGRVVMGIGGAFLMLLFLLPWHGASSWQLLETLSGTDFVRQLFYLAGGLILLVTAILPLPVLFRAGVGASIAALPVLLGARGVLDGWRGVVVALAMVGLPATYLRSRAQKSQAARPLVLAAVAAVALLYLPVMLTLRGLSMDDSTQLYVGVSLLWASTISAVSLAQLLSRAARPQA